MSLRRIVLVIAATLVGAVALLAGSAGAVSNPDYTAPPPTTVVSTPPPAEQVPTAASAAPVRTRLAITGSDAAAGAVIGASLVVLGIGVLAVRRRATSAAS